MKIYCPNCKKAVEPEIPADAREVQCPACSKNLTVPETPLSPGAVLNDFLLEKSLSSGGMGVVYLARQISLDRLVALKVLHNKFADNQEYIEGLFREARAAAKLTHPNIVQAYAVGEENGIFYFAMEYIRGETFKQILKRQNVLDTDQAVKVIRDICQALHAAWNEQKLVHQDIKPDNIMLDSNGFAKLADLGLARSANTDSGPAEDENEVMGTPQYISPEQLTGVPTDVRSDIYSLGATFYQFVTGQFPYPEETAEEMAKKHVEGNLTPPIAINPQLPQAINDIIVKMMARNIEERYQDPNEVIADLDAFTEQKKRGALAMPKLKLSLNKKASDATAAPKLGVPAKPGLPAKPGIPAKPAAKPAVPAPPVKPAAPAKPAVPAPPVKPAAPAKPTAQPAAPAQPAPPAESTPALATVSLVKDDEEIALTPKAPKNKPQEEQGNKDEKKGKGASEDKNDKAKNKDKAKDKKKRVREKPAANVAGIIVAAVFLLPLVLIMLAVALYIVAQKGHLGEKGKQHAAAAMAYLKSQMPQPKTRTAPVPIAKAPAETRKEFVSKLSELMEFYRMDPTANSAKFLKDSDAFLLSSLMPPATAKENEVYQEFRGVYALADEELRAQPARQKQIARIEGIYNLKIQEARKKEAEAERQRLLAIEQEKIRKEEQEKKRLEDIQIAKRSAELKAEIKKHFENLSSAFVNSLRNNDPELYNTALTQAQDYIPSLDNISVDALNYYEEFKRFRDDFMKKAAEEFGKFQSFVQTISSDNSFPIGNPMVDVIKIMPLEGKIMVRSADGLTTRSRVLKKRSERAELYKELNKKAQKLFKDRKYEYSGFYFEFLEGNLTSRIGKNNLPPYKWNEFLKYFTKEIKISKSLL